MTLPKRYSPEECDAELYARSQARGVFSPAGNKDIQKPHLDPFVVMMPPPNVTGSLHIGHALNYTLQDILVRYHRMRGHRTFWQPGTDHAGIATQMVVSRELAQKGVDRRDIGREAFLEHVWQWKEKYGAKIVQQQRQLGLSTDWSRQRFTMDTGLNEAVKEVFVRLFEDGLIYRAKRLVNWDLNLQTAVSDLEVVPKEVQGAYWTIHYTLAADPTQGIDIATTRPETLFGDVAIAVHPEDPRYQHLVGRQAIVPLVGREIPIIADSYCDPEKGSGAVKITPAHDFNDYEVGARHNLPRHSVMDFQGKLTDSVPAAFQGLDRFAARDKVVACLEQQGKIRAVDTTTHVVPHGERSDSILEPLLMDQWFVDVSSLASQALERLDHGETVLYPNNQRNTLAHWLTSIQPWCISRQLWWGHRIPIWYGPDGHAFAARTAEEAAQKAAAHYGEAAVVLHQDEDVLDTWFSSALWPFSTLGWPEDAPELTDFFPTSTLVTGTDILFFWVARMMMMSLYVHQKMPFKDVFLHALVRDKNGQKMSKTKGNVIDPLLMIERYGADALRFSMAMLAAPGREIRFSDQHVEQQRNFVTKVWNAARFITYNDIALQDTLGSESLKHTGAKWLYQSLYVVSESLQEKLAHYRFDEAATVLYRFIWTTFCDWGIELCKVILNSDQNTAAEKQEMRHTIGFCFDKILRLLHPFMPFVTQKLYDEMAPQARELAVTPWPEMAPLKDTNATDRFGRVMAIVSQIRSIRSQFQITAKQELEVILVVTSEPLADFLKDHAVAIQRLALVSALQFASENPQAKGLIRLVVDDVVVCVNLAGIVDLAAEQKRLKAEVHKALKEESQLQKKLDNADFVAKAPSAVVDKNIQRLEETRKLIAQLEDFLSRFS